MNKTIRLDEIIEGMEAQSEQIRSFLNTKTGEVVIIMEEEFSAAEDDEDIEDFPEWQLDNIKAAKDILENEEDYIGLPSKFDINEYGIMEGFCLSINDDKIRNVLYSSIKGSGAFRRFKENIHKFNVADDWYKYRYNAIKQIAIDWCEEKCMNFTED